jgi:hypothetical protein
LTKTHALEFVQPDSILHIQQHGPSRMPTAIQHSIASVLTKNMATPLGDTTLLFISLFSHAVGIVSHHYMYLFCIQTDKKNLYRAGYQDFAFEDNHAASFQHGSRGAHVPVRFLSSFCFESFRFCAFYACPLFVFHFKLIRHTGRWTGIVLRSF